MINEFLIDEYINTKRYKQINSVLVYKNNELIVQKFYNGFDINSTNVIRSVSKSIVSICAGICLDKGIIKSLDEPIYKYLSEFDGREHMYHKKITIRNLLNMTSGIFWNGGVHYHCPLLKRLHRSNNWIDFISNIEVVDFPGTKFNYKEFDIILLGAVLEKAINDDLFSFANENLYKPLEIASGTWWKSKCGVTYSIAYGDEGPEEVTSNLSSQDMLKIGLLFLNKGIYNGHRIISESYINEATKPSIKNKNYGLMWWLGDNYYGCTGYGGQCIIVSPNKNMVFVIQATPTSRGMEYKDLRKFILENG